MMSEFILDDTTNESMSRVIHQPDHTRACWRAATSRLFSKAAAVANSFVILRAVIPKFATVSTKSVPNGRDE